MILLRADVRQRLATGAAVAVLHLAAIYGLIAAFAGGLVVHRPDSATLLSIFAAKARPEPPPLPPQRSTGGAPRAAGKQAEAAPVLAAAIIANPSPLPAAPMPSEGSASSSGAAEAGTGPGGGGSGEGTGDGEGDGEGSGTDLRLISGGIYEEDYPREAIRLRQSGKVHIRFTVSADGRVSACDVTRSSGSPSLDAATCRLILRRFRYEPSRDAAGRPRADTVEGVHHWRMAGRINDEDDGEGDGEGDDLASAAAR